jgi:hypothetical protein
MCGSSSQQDENYAEQAAFAKQMQAENSTVFGQQQGILSSLNAGFQKIIDAGPSQQGFSADQKNDLDTQATEAVARNMTMDKQALGNGQAAQGGGDTFIPSGVTDQQNEELAATGASTDSTLHSQILQDDYTQGNTNYNNAVTGQTNVAGMLNPVGYSTATSTAGSNAGNEANAIAASANSPFTAVMGALGAVGGAAIGKMPSFGGAPAAPCHIAAELYGGWNEPRTVAIRAWLINDFEPTALGGPLVSLYRRYGKQTAAAVKRYKPLRWLFTPLFNLALKKAQAR